MRTTTKTLALTAILSLLLLPGCRFYQQQKRVAVAAIAHAGVDALLRMQAATPLSQSSSRPLPSHDSISVIADREQSPSMDDEAAPAADVADSAEIEPVDDEPLPTPMASFTYVIGNRSEPAKSNLTIACSALKGRYELKTAKRMVVVVNVDDVINASL